MSDKTKSIINHIRLSLLRFTAATFLLLSVYADLRANHAYLIYRSTDMTSQVSYRDWDDHDWTERSYYPNTEVKPMVAALETSPVADEMVLAVLDDDRHITLSTRTASGDWGYARTLSTIAFTVSNYHFGDGNVSYFGYSKSFDVAYESQSGNILSAYSDFHSTIAWSYHDGVSWSSGTFDSSFSTIPVIWIELASNPASDEILMVSQHADLSIWGSVWDGSEWGNYQALVSTVAAPIQSGQENWFDVWRVRNFDADYTASGTAMVVWTEKGEGTPRYRTWSGSWSEEGETSGTHGHPQWVQVDAQKSGNNFILGTWGSETLNNSGDIVGEIYKNGSWGDRQVMGSAVHSAYGNEAFGVAYSRNYAMFVTAPGELRQRYRIYDGTSWSGEMTTPDDGLFSSSVILEADPESDEIFLLAAGTQDPDIDDYNPAYIQLYDGEFWDEGIPLGSGSGPRRDRAVRYRSYNPEDVTPPKKIRDLEAADPMEAGKVRLSWETRGEFRDGQVRALPEGAAYRIQYSITEDVAWSYDSAQIEISTHSVTPGESVSATIALTPEYNYFFRIWAKDDSGLWSRPSNITSYWVKPYDKTFIEDDGSGMHSDMATDSEGNLHLVYSDGSSLIYRKRNGSAWGSPQTVRSDTGGEFISVAVDNQNRPHVSYFMTPSGGLGYSYFNGSEWVSGTVEEGANVGRWSSLVLSGSSPRIAYHSTNRLHYASGSIGSWNIETVEERGFEDFYYGISGSYPSLSLSASGIPSIAFRVESYQQLVLATRVSGVWNFSVVEQGDGSFPSLVYDEDNQPHIAHYGGEWNKLIYSYYDGAEWQSEILEEQINVYNAGIRLILDAYSTPHIFGVQSTYDGLVKDTHYLNYFRYDAELSTWTAYTVETVGPLDAAYHNMYPSSAMTPDGELNLIYFNRETDEFIHKVWSAMTFAEPLDGEAPSGLNASDITNESIEWSWTSNSTNEIGFRFYLREQGGSGVFELVAGTDTLTAGSDTFTHDAQPNRAYTAFIVAIPPAGPGKNSEEAEAIAKAKAPSELIVTSRNDTSISITWNRNLNYGTQYEIERSTDDFGTIDAILTNFSGSFTDTPLSPDTTYYYRVRALNNDESGPTDYSNIVSTKTFKSPPAAPTDFTGTVVSTTTIEFTWTDNADNEDGYRIYSSTGGILTELPPGTESWLQAGLSPNTGSTALYVYAYHFNDEGDSRSPDLDEPVYTLSNPPLGTNVTDRMESTISIDWLPNDNPAYTRWEVERSDDGVNYEIVLTLGEGHTDTFYEDTGLQRRIEYYYRVRAFNENDISTEYDIAVSTVTLDETPPGKIEVFSSNLDLADVSSIILEWESPGNDGYEGNLSEGAAFLIQYDSDDPSTVNWSTASAQIFLPVTAEIEPGVVLSTKATGLDLDIEYWFRIWTKDESGNYSAISGTVSAVTGGYYITEEIPDSPSADYLSIALKETEDPANPEVHAIYRSGGLKYSLLDSTLWSTESLGFSGYQHTDVAIDSEGNPHIIYFQGPVGTNRLWYARFDGAEWHHEVVQLDGGRRSSLALDAHDRPHIIYYHYSGSWPNEVLEYRYITKHNNEWGHFSGSGGTTWNTGHRLVLSLSGSVPYGETGIAVDLSGRVHMAFRRIDEWGGNRLGYSRYNGGFTHYTPDSTSGSGDYASLTVSPDSVAHIAYESGSNLRHVSGSGSFSFTNVDNLSGGGKYTSIKLDGAGNPVIAYYNNSSKDLMLSSYNGSSWSRETLESTGDVGSYASLAIDGLGNYHIAHSDVTNNRALYTRSYGGPFAPSVTRPSGFETVDIWVSSASYSWNSARNHTEYRVYDTARPHAYSQKAAISSDSGSYTESDLTPNTTHYRNIVAVNDGTYAFSNPLVFTTLAAQPSDTVIISRSTDSVTLSWDANLNPAWTSYTLLRSNDNFETSQEINDIIMTEYTDTGLDDNTTYYYRVSAWSICGVQTPYAAAVSTRTLRLPPNAPSEFSAMALSTTTIEFSWTSNSADEDGFRLYSSTSWPMGETAAGVTEWVQEGLTPNTSSYVSGVVAFHETESSSSELAASVFTHANPPFEPGFVEVGVLYSSFSWQANSNPDYTRWEIIRSVDDLFTSSETLKGMGDDYRLLYYVDEGLSPDTEYFYRIRAFNEDDIPSEHIQISTQTRPLPAAPSSFAGEALSTTTIRFTWEDNSDDEEGFRIYTATVGVLKELVADTTYWIQVGLTPNTSSYANFIRAFNEDESLDSNNIDPVYTLVNEPSEGSIESVTASSINISWQENNNPPWTFYNAHISTDSEFNPVDHSSGWQEGITSYLFEGLAANATYYLRVLARNNNEIETDYHLIGSSVTVVAAPDSLDLEVISNSEIKAVWESGGNILGTVYAVQRSTWNGFSGDLDQVETTDTEYIFEGLGVNSKHWVRIAAIDRQGDYSSWTDIASAATLANDPLELIITDVTDSSIELSWGAGGNPEGTFWSVLRSENDFITYDTIKDFGDEYSQLEYADTGLNQNTTYYYRVAAINRDAELSGYAEISTTTLILPFIVETVMDDLRAAQSRISVDKDGVKHIAFRESNSLKYFSDSGSGWEVTSLDTSGNVIYLDMKATSAGDVHIIYTSRELDQNVLKYAHYDSELEYWSFSFIDYASQWNPVALDIDAAGRLHAAYKSANGNYLKYARFDGEWSTYEVGNFPNWDGELDIALAPDSTVHLAFLDSTEGGYSIAYLCGNPGNWSEPNSDITFEYYLRYPLSLRVDSSGRAHLIYNYQEEPEEEYLSYIDYALWNGSGWDIEGVAAYEYDLSADEGMFIENMSNLTLDSSGEAHLAYSLFTYSSDTDIVESFLIGLVRNDSQWEEYSISVSTADRDGVFSGGNRELISLSRGPDGKDHLVYTETTDTGVIFRYAYSDGVITLAPVSAPEDFTVTDVSVDSADWSWSVVAGVMGYRLYDVSEYPYILIAGTDTLGAGAVSFSESGLTPNIKLERVILSVSEGTFAGSYNEGWTLAVPPTGLAVDSRTSSSVTLNWSRGANPEYTVFGIQRASDETFDPYEWALSSSAALTDETYTDTGLELDTEYFYRMLSFNGEGVASGYTAPVSTRTLEDDTPPDPVNNLEAFTGAENGQILLQWTATGDDGMEGDIVGGFFYIYYSTHDSGSYESAQIKESTSTSPGSVMSYSLEGLIPGADYAISVWLEDDSLNVSERSNEVNALAGLNPPTAPSDFSGVALSYDSILWSWADNSSVEEEYLLKDSEDNIIATLPADSEEWLQEGLSANFSSTLYLEASNAAGESALPAETVYTLSRPPLEEEVLGRSYYSISFGWDTNSNPEYTRWGILRSVDNFALSTETLKVFGDDFTGYAYTDDSALEPDTLYYYKVFSYNEDGIESDYLLFSTSTYPSPPAPPSDFTGEALSVSSIEWTWTDNADNGEGYRVLTATGGVIAILGADVESWVEEDLEPNTLYIRSVESYNITASSGSAAAEEYTLANPPLSPYFEEVSALWLRLNWDNNMNAEWTRWRIERSEDDFLTSEYLINFEDNHTDTSYLDEGLELSTEYSYRIYALNENDIISGYVELSTTTLDDIWPPAPVSNLSAETGSQEKSVLLSWTAVGNDDLEGDITGGKYSIRYSSIGAINEENWYEAYEILIDTDTSPGNSEQYLVGGLIPGERYWFAIKTMDGINWSEINEYASDVTALARTLNPPTLLSGTPESDTSIRWEWSDNSSYETGYSLFDAISGDLIVELGADDDFYVEESLQPNQRYSRVVVMYDETLREYESNYAEKYTLAREVADLEIFSPASNAVSLSWSANSNPAGTRYGVDISIDNFSSHTVVRNYASGHTLNEVDIFGLSPETLYYVRVRAFNHEGEATGYLSVSTTTLADSDEILIESEEEFEVAVEDDTPDPVTGGVERVLISVPSGTFLKPVKARIENVGVGHIKNTIAEEASSKGRFRAVSRIYDFIIRDKTGAELQPSDFTKKVELEFTYTGEFNAAQRNLMRVFYLNEGSREWEEVLDYDILPDKKKIIARVEHTSVYTVMQLEASSFDDMKVYPNPFVVSEAVGGLLKFSGVPEDIRLYIYNISGELVYDQRNTATGGGIEWEGVNNSGSQLASGLYFYRIEDSSGKSKTGRVMVIR